MKKILKYITIFIIAILTIGNVYATPSEFSSLVDYEYDMDNKEIFIILGFDGEPAYKVSESVIYDNKYVELSEAICQEDFEMVEKNSIIENGEIKEEFTCESQSIYDDTKYLLLVFKMKDTFRVGKSAYITIKDIVAYGEEYKYRDTGTYVIVKREGPVELTIIPKPYNDSIKFRLWMEDNIVWICFGFIALFLFIIFIFMPTISRTESKSSKVRRQLRAPKLSKNLQKIKIEEEKNKVEKDIAEYKGFNPFEKNVAKSSQETIKTSDELRNDINVFEPKKKVKAKANFASAIEEFTEITDTTNAVKGKTNSIVNQQTDKVHSNTDDDLILFNPVHLDDANKTDKNS